MVEIIILILLILLWIVPMDKPKIGGNPELSAYIQECANPNYKYLNVSKEQAYRIGIQKLADYVKTRFPIKAMSISPVKLNEMFQNLATYKPQFNYNPFNFPALPLPASEVTVKLTAEAQPTLLLNYPELYEKVNLIVEYFMDIQRMRVKRLDTRYSPLEQFTYNPGKFILEALKYGKLDAYTLREAIYKLTHEATEFKPSVMAALIEMFKPKKVLDFSAGRGARMIACIAKQVHYEGIDPDTELQSGYKAMIEAFPPTQKTIVHVGKAQEMDKLPLPTDFDLAFTSCPYFNLEHYSDSPDQSDVEFNEVDSWLAGFMFPSIEKACERLKPTGYFCLNISDPGQSVKNRPLYTMRILEYLKKHNRLEYQGVMGYAEGSKAAQPIWICKKI